MDETVKALEIAERLRDDGWVVFIRLNPKEYPDRYWVEASYEGGAVSAARQSLLEAVQTVAQKAEAMVAR